MSVLSLPLPTCNFNVKFDEGGPLFWNVQAFRAARLFDYVKVAEMQPDANDVASLLSFLFVSEMEVEEMPPLLAACENAQAADTLQWWKSLEVSFQAGLLYLRKFSLSSLALLLLKECFLCWKTLLERTRPLPWRSMSKAP